MKGQGRGKRSRFERLKACGSISLALCLIMPVALFMFASLIFESQRVRAQVDLARGAVSIAESALALYDRDLYRDFGLFAIDSQVLDRALSSLIGPQDQASYALEAQDFLSDLEVLKASVARHMAWRSACSLIKDAMDKFDQIKGMEASLSLADLNERIPAGSQAGIQAVDQPLDYKPGEEPDWYEDYSDYMDDEVRAVYQEGLSNLAPAVLPAEDGSVQTFDFDPYTGGGLDTLTSLVDQVLFTPPEGILDRIMLSEYALSYFKSKTSFVIRDGIRYEDKTPDGRTISLFSETRNLELEEIATGLTGGAASSVMIMFISSIRFVLHLLNVLMDAGLMADYRQAAGIVAAAIAVISLGEVVIPPEAMTWILIVGDSLRKSVSESLKLQKGYELNLWPGYSEVNVAMRYKDYVRLLLVVQSPDTIAGRIATVLARVYPGLYATRVICQADWGEVSLTHAAAFITRPPQGGQEEG